MSEKIILFSVIIASVCFLNGCSFMVPEDDLNGNNGKVSPINKISVPDDQVKNPEISKEDSDIEQLEQAVNQADYEMQMKEKKEKQDVIPEIKENTDIEKELLTYTNKYTKAKIKTNLGNIRITLYGTDAPMAVGNFIKLAENGFYNKIKFHRVISGFMIQGGDPNSKDENWEDDGKGGPGYAFRDESNAHKLIKGSLAMANSGKDTNGSQFFIVTAESTPHLDGKHTNFGEVIEGMDTVEKIEKVRINEKDHPTQDVVIEGIELEK
jgi:cyclophilin family peptidyl-prolyl cis-trans isomerase